MMKHAANYLRGIGDGVNALAVVVFAIVTLKLYGMASAYLAAAGGLPPLTPEGVKALATSPDLKGRLTYWAAAWFSGIGAAGCGWMTLLGTRSVYQWLLRLMAR